MRRAKIVSILLLLFFPVSQFAEAFADDTGIRPAPVISVIVDDGRLWGTFHDAPLEDAIRAIGESVPFDVKLHGALSGTTGKHFHGAPVIDVLRRLLANQSWVGVVDRNGRVSRLLVYGSRPAAPGDDQLQPPGAKEGGAVPAQTAHADPRSDSGAWADRLEALQNLAREQPLGAASVLTSTLAEDEDPILRWNAAIALADIPDRLASQALAEALVDYGELPAVRRLAAWALGRRRDNRAAWALHSATFDLNEEVRQASLEALRAIRRPADDQVQRQRLGRTAP